MPNKNSQPWFTHKTRNILGAALLVLTVVFAVSFVWHQRQPSAERAAQEIAVVFASLDYRDQDGWRARLKEVSDAAGCSFWSYTMEHGMWAGKPLSRVLKMQDTAGKTRSPIVFEASNGPG